MKTQLILKSTLLAGLLVSLAGCANFSKVFEVQTPAQMREQQIEQAEIAQQQLTDQCNQSTVLYADLSIPATKRIYSLPSGKTCVLSIPHTTFPRDGKTRKEGVGS